MIGEITISQGLWNTQMKSPQNRHLLKFRIRTKWMRNIKIRIHIRHLINYQRITKMMKWWILMRNRRMIILTKRPQAWISPTSHLCPKMWRITPKCNPVRTHLPRLHIRMRSKKTTTTCRTYRNLLICNHRVAIHTCQEDSNLKDRLNYQSNLIGIILNPIKTCISKQSIRSRCKIFIMINNW